MDFVLSLNGYPNISIDIKDYAKSVPKTEVLKFENDMVIGNTHGIMVSISTKIIGKPHFTIEVIKGKVAIYLSNTSYDFECVKIAVEVIYNMHKVLDINGKMGISQDIVNDIERLLREDLSKLLKVKESLTMSLEYIKDMTTSRIIDLLQKR
jgi:hypothetical protein